MDITAQESTAARVRSLIERLDPQEKRMFGTIALMVDDALQEWIGATLERLESGRASRRGKP